MSPMEGYFIDDVTKATCLITTCSNANATSSVFQIYHLMVTINKMKFMRASHSLIIWVLLDLIYPIIHLIHGRISRRQVGVAFSSE